MSISVNQPVSIPPSLEPQKIRALALDLDGTLLAPGGVLNERTAEAVRKCGERGLRIIIATGRAIEAAERFRLPLGAEGPMIYFNGAVVADMPGTEIISSTLHDIEVAEFCVDLARDMGLYYQIFLSGINTERRITFMAEKDGPEREMYFRHTGILAELGNLKEALRSTKIRGCIKSMFLAEPEIQAVIRPRLDERFGKSVYVTQTLRTFLEIMDAKVSKGRGLKIVMERCSLKAEEVMAFGDEENDLPMFKYAGFSAAPSNAKESVKAAATVVVGSNAEDGVAAFLEDIFLG
jgi:Cof subfamily protein (haloacid dehalogenase superfamily)